MLSLKNGAQILQPGDALPPLPKAPAEAFIDVETTGLSPWKGDRVCGIGATWDDSKKVYYLPVRHRDASANLAPEPAFLWTRELVRRAGRVVNHNVKFDMHFLARDGVDNWTSVVDTLTAAKLIDSDRFKYDLTSLAKDWLNADISWAEKRVSGFLGSVRDKAKNYSWLPADVLGEYCCLDVSVTRDLYRCIGRRLPEECRDVYDTERLLTPVLYDIEENGLRVDVEELQKKRLECLYRLLRLEEKISDIVGGPMRPHTNEDCFDVLCNRYGLPVLGRTEKGDPSFDQEALARYFYYVRHDPKLTGLIDKILAYRKIHTFNGLFVEQYLKLQVDGLLHPEYNQSVRTGRLACHTPNAQQISTEAKALIHAPAGRRFLSYDYSQIEFRIIVHYIQNEEAIRAYLENPDTDFHQWVADLCHISRRPAKNVNFMMGYGGGRDLCVSMLRQEEELAKSVNTEKGLVALAYAVYDTYHARLPELKRTSHKAAVTARQRGYVKDAYGRRRHLRREFTWRAFNTVMQASAADVIKDRLVAVAPRYNRETREAGARIAANVHDEILFDVPERFRAYGLIKRTLEAPKVAFRVPIVVKHGKKSKIWES